MPNMTPWIQNQMAMQDKNMCTHLCVLEKNDECELWAQVNKNMYKWTTSCYVHATMTNVLIHQLFFHLLLAGTKSKLFLWTLFDAPYTTIIRIRTWGCRKVSPWKCHYSDLIIWSLRFSPGSIFFLYFYNLAFRFMSVIMLLFSCFSFISQFFRLSAYFHQITYLVRSEIIISGSNRIVEYFLMCIFNIFLGSSKWNGDNRKYRTETSIENKREQEYCWFWYALSIDSTLRKHEWQKAE